MKSAAAPGAKWLFVNERQDLWDEGAVVAGLSRLAASWAPGLDAQVAGTTPLIMVAVLRGDVTGSWSAPEGAVDLDALEPGYLGGWLRAWGRRRMCGGSSVCADRSVEVGCVQPR